MNSKDVIEDIFSDGRINAARRGRRCMFGDPGGCTVENHATNTTGSCRG
jgi:hypothetical protein